MEGILDFIKARLPERTSWDGATIIVVSLLIIVAAPIVKLLAWLIKLGLNQGKF